MCQMGLAATRTGSPRVRRWRHHRRRAPAPRRRWARAQKAGPIRKPKRRWTFGFHLLSFDRSHGSVHPAPQAAREKERSAVVRRRTRVEESSTTARTRSPWSCGYKGTLLGTSLTTDGQRRDQFADRKRSAPGAYRAGSNGLLRCDARSPLQARPRLCVQSLLSRQSQDIRNRFSIIVLAAALAGCSEDITVINMSPTPTIAAPAHESSFMSGDVITFQGLRRTRRTAC